jgi:hypothetical protein
MIMKLDYIPLLRVQRELHEIPRGMGRFAEYLRTTLNEDRTDVELLPLLIMNPMGKDHVTVLLDAFLAIDADGIGAEAAAEASARLADVPGDFKATLVVADDLMGGWTNRYAYEFQLRNWPPVRNHHRFWVTGVLWTSEVASARAAREAVLSAAYRAAYMQQHGLARTLRDLIAQEGWVMATAGCTGPVLDRDDIAYTREVLAPYLDAEANMRTAVEFLFGDAAARTLGFTPRGLSLWAGLALALHDARIRAPSTPQTNVHGEAIQQKEDRSPGGTSAAGSNSAGTPV